MKYTLTFGITYLKATQRVMETELTRLTHKNGIQLNLVAESCTICSSRSRRPDRKLLDTPSYIFISVINGQRQELRAQSLHLIVTTHTVTYVHLFTLLS